MAKWQFLVGMVVALLAAGPVWADSTETHLTPQSPRANGLAFQVTAKDVGQVKELTVLVRAEEGKEFSPFLGATLEVYEGKRLVISCPVEKQAGKGGFRYRFYVSPQDLGKVRFTFTEYAYARVPDNKGGVRVQPMPSMDRYWFIVKGFVGGR